MTDTKTPPGSPSGQEPTFSLVARAARGDVDAQNRLTERYWRSLQRWAHGRLPLDARERADTDDLVQITILKTLDSLGTFDPRHEGAFTGYLHKILLNQIRDEIRRARRRPYSAEIPESLAAKERSPLTQAMEKEFVDAYERALETLSAEQRRAVVMRLELGHSYQEIADELGKSSPDAARMTVNRALSRLAELMHS